MGGSKTAILAQVVYFYFGAVGHITIGGDMWLQQKVSEPLMAALAV